MSLRLFMNESEMRRRELLKQTRRLYNDHHEIPAVHPRYGRIYNNLYGSEPSGAQQTESSGNSFYIRLLIGILCFVFYVYLDQSSAEIAQVNSTVIAEQIGQEADMDSWIEAWKTP